MFKEDSEKFRQIMQDYNLTTKLIAQLMEVKISKVHFWRAGLVKFTPYQQSHLMLRLQQYFSEKLEEINKSL